MKKLILLLAISLLTVNLSIAQTPHKVYCEIVGAGNNTGNKVSSVEVDFGQSNSTCNIKSRILVGDDNKVVPFNSMMDAVNFFAVRGWSLLFAYGVTETQGISRQTAYHYILFKEITNDEQIKEGIKLKE
jgi:hypothetical protein